MLTWVKCTYRGELKKQFQKGFSQGAQKVQDLHIHMYHMYSVLSLSVSGSL